MEEVTCLVLNNYPIYPIMKTYFNDKLPMGMQKHKWPKLLYLELGMRFFPLNQTLLTLFDAAPNLVYLKLYYPTQEIPSLMLTFLWDWLPWQTGFVTSCGKTCGGKVTLAIQDKGITKIDRIVPTKLMVDGIVGGSDLDVDLSNNELTSLDYLQFTMHGDTPFHSTSLLFNLSHNNLEFVLLYYRIQIIPVTVNPSNNNYRINNLPRVYSLDLSFNQLGNENSDYLLFNDLQYLYLNNNNYTDPPFCRFSILNQELGRDFQMRPRYIGDLRELTHLDLSYNYISADNYSQYGPLEQLSLNGSSSLEFLYLSHNQIHLIPPLVYKADSLRYIDLSYNGITKWPFVYTSHMNDIADRSPHRAVNLSYNQISHIWINMSCNIPMAKILGNCDIYLQGNPIECDCETHRIYEFLISSSKSEGLNETLESSPDFSFYETQWKCMNPLEWAGIPLMQIPEYEYDQKCVLSLDKCPDECYCHHSWTLDNVIVSNCSHGNELALSTLPASVSDSTSHLFLSHNNIRTLCGTNPYLNDLKYIDISGNKLEMICSDVLRSMINLEHLILTNNMLTYIAQDLWHLKSLKQLIIKNNILETLQSQFKT